MTERERRQRIIDHLRAGQAQDAADELAGSCEPYPGDGILHHAIGLAFASGGTLGPAREQLEAAVRLTPDSAPILADLAQVCLAQGRAKDALETAEQARELDPHLAIAHFTIGRACLAAACAQQARHASYRDPGFDFPLMDGTAPLYLRAVREMETALYASPPFVGAVRIALAFAYVRAGHFHAAVEQLHEQLADLPPGEEFDRVAERLRCVEHEIAREAYWSAVAQPDPRTSAEPPLDEPEVLLRRAHAHAVAGNDTALAEALATARSAGYQPRPAIVSCLAGQDEFFREVSDVHLLLCAALECILDGKLRFLPFSELDAITLGPVAPWRAAQVQLASGDSLEVAVPALYRLSLRSPNDLIQSGRFTQFKYDPGETRYARAIGTRNIATERRVIPFAEIKSIVFT
ncbi:MAG TPA: type VI secretion system accessory protein TagJ [Armatimonadota bacterium]|nr:type VI secretion system accessory protein TagJ [Armatimonadota bacterium]